MLHQSQVKVLYYSKYYHFIPSSYIHQDKVVSIGCDKQETNTELKRGIIKLLERKFKKPLPYTRFVHSRWLTTAC